MFVPVADYTTHLGVHNILLASSMGNKIVTTAGRYMHVCHNVHEIRDREPTS